MATNEEVWLAQAFTQFGEAHKITKALEWRRNEDKHENSQRARHRLAVETRCKRYISTLYAGFSRHGHPVSYELGGANCWPREWKESMSQKDYIIHVGNQLEHELGRAIERNPDGPHPIAKGVAIYVVDGSGYGHKNLEMLSYLRAAHGYYTDKYPKPLHAFIMINTPWYMQCVQSIIRAAIGNLAHHVVFVGTGKKEILTELTRFIDTAQIPEAYGGSLRLSTTGTFGGGIRFEAPPIPTSPMSLQSAFNRPLCHHHHHYQDGQQACIFNETPKRVTFTDS